MKQKIFTVTSNESIAKDTMLINLSGDTDGMEIPGQFVNIKIDGLFLRRPISVCDWDKNTLTLIYKIVGEGTQKLSEYREGKELDILTGLGNGYDMSVSGLRPLLLGGGVGVPPLFGLCRRLAAAGKKPLVVLGFNSACDMFYENEFKALGADVTVTTADGSYGIKGFVTDAIRDMSYSYFYACGPEPMLKAVYDSCNTQGQFSFEERMGCGFGACMGCTCKTKYGSKRICKDGPVLTREEIVW